MYPHKIFLNITMYDILFALGVLGALVVFRVLSDKRGREAGLFNFSLMSGVAAIVGGVFASVLFQAIYNFAETGVFEINADTGMTFYGGLIGGVFVFVVLYFGVGHLLFRDNAHIGDFRSVSDAAACSIAFAHAMGRMGCFFAGCCHGIAVPPPLGVYMEFAGETVLPVQLYESLFLFGLAAFMMWRYIRGRQYGMPIYMVGYGVWRFFIEYLRGDERGATFVSFLSPSQLTALVLVVGGTALWIFECRRDAAKRTTVNDENEQNKD